MRRGLGTSRTTLNIANHRGARGEEEEQKIENLFEQIMKENFPNLAKELDFYEVQKPPRIPKKLDPRKHAAKHVIITLPKIKDKGRILKAAREKETTYKGVPVRLSADLRRGWKGSIPSNERQGPASKMTLSSKAII